MAAAKQSLATRALRGVFWSASPFLLHSFTLLFFFAQEETGQMGTFATALLWVNLLAILGDLGFSAALVQRRQVNEQLFSSVFWTNLSFGCLLSVFVLLLRAYLADLAGLLDSPSLKDPFLAQTLGYLCLLVPFASVSGIFRARLLRDLDFKAPALAEVVSVLTYALASLLLWSHYGIWALVVGSLIREIAMFVSLWVSAAWVPRFRYDFAELKQLFFFGANVSGERLIGAVNSRIAQLLIYPFMTPVAAGYYIFATQFSTTPLIRLSTILQRVALPTMSTMQDEDQRLGRVFVSSVQSVALVFWPPLMLLLVFTAEIVIVVRQDYLAVVPTLQLLVLATVFKSVGAIVSSVFLAKGKAHWSFRWALFSLVVLTLLMLVVVLRFNSIAAVAAVVLLSSVGFFVTTQVLVHRLIRFELGAYLAGLVRPVIIAVFVFWGLTLCRAYLIDSFLTDGLSQVLLNLVPALGPARLEAMVVLVQAGCLSLALYAVALRLFAWGLCRDYWHNLRGRGSE